MEDKRTKIAEDKWTNVLQLPMQPLSENLSNDLYQSFESCPVKYKSYEEAIEKAILSLNKNEVVLYVVGAGRGAFVNSCVNIRRRFITRKVDVKLNVYAVDKNPISIANLNRKKNEWNKEENIVFVLEGDMRYITPPKKCHIIISELLGSFGDNELSPECLLGLESILAENVDEVIMIPKRYTSYVVPATLPIPLSNIPTNHNSYVCKLFGEKLIGSPQPCFSFSHPNTVIDQKHSILEWSLTKRQTINCVVGYFDCLLIEGIGFSTNPSPPQDAIPFSENMTSWHPMLFLLEENMYGKHDDKVQLDMWRKHNDSIVWYEWQITILSKNGIIRNKSKIHNKDGSKDFMSKSS